MVEVEGCGDVDGRGVSGVASEWYEKIMIVTVNNCVQISRYTHVRDGQSMVVLCPFHSQYYY